MTLNKSFLSVLLALAVAAGNSHAQDLQSYKKKYDDALFTILTEQSQQVANINKIYATGLNTLKDQVQAAGDLNKLKATLSEISKFEKDQALPDAKADLTPEIGALRSKCQNAIEETELSKARAIVNLAAGYDRALIALQRDLTRQGEVDKASSVQEERRLLTETETLVTAKSLLEKTTTQVPQNPIPQQQMPEMRAAEADTFVHNRNPGNNFGREATILLKKDSAHSREAYLRFNLSGLKGLKGQFRKASIRLHCVSVEGNPTVNRAYLVQNDEWDENKVAWNSRPQAETTSFVEWLSPASGKPVTFDVTEVVKKEANGDGLISICIRSEGYPLIEYGTKESSKAEHRPTLIIER